MQSELQKKMEKNTPDQPIIIYVCLLSFLSLICRLNHPHFLGTVAVLKTVNVSASIQFTQMNHLLQVDHIAKTNSFNSLPGYSDIYRYSTKKATKYLKFLCVRELAHTYLTSSPCVFSLTLKVCGMKQQSLPLVQRCMKRDRYRKRSYADILGSPQSLKEGLLLLCPSILSAL